MRHDMKSPCGECPFRTDIRGYLRPGRVTEIATSLARGQSFPCHKTVDYRDDDEGQVTDNSRQCAGAEIFLAHQGASTQMSRIAERLGMKVSPLDMDAPVCRTVGEMLAVHSGDDAAEGEPCCISGDGCEAPAGMLVDGMVIDGTESAEYECAHCGEAVCGSCSVVSGRDRACEYCAEMD